MSSRSLVIRPIKIACMECARGKRSCSGRPPCERCTRLGKACTWPDIVQDVNIEQDLQSTLSPPPAPAAQMPREMHLVPRALPSHLPPLFFPWETVRALGLSASTDFMARALEAIQLGCWTLDPPGSASMAASDTASRAAAEGWRGRASLDLQEIERSSGGGVAAWCILCARSSEGCQVVEIWDTPALCSMFGLASGELYARSCCNGPPPLLLHHDFILPRCLEALKLFPLEPGAGDEESEDSESESTEGSEGSSPSSGGGGGEATSPASASSPTSPA